MSNKNEVVPPLVLVQTFTNKYPGVWDRIDLLREKTLQGEIDAIVRSRLKWVRSQALAPCSRFLVLPEQSLPALHGEG